MIEDVKVLMVECDVVECVLLLWMIGVVEG